jgi:hypothetical protein
MDWKDLKSFFFLFFPLQQAVPFAGFSDPHCASNNFFVISNSNSNFNAAQF